MSNPSRPQVADIESAVDEAIAAVSAASTPEELRLIANAASGKKGRLAGIKASLGGITDIDERKAVGQAVNEALGGPLDGDGIARLYERIMDEARRIQRLEAERDAAEQAAAQNELNLKSEG